MAGKGSEKTQFKPGNTVNPGGRPSLPPEVREAKKLNRVMMETALNKFLGWPNEALISFSEDDKNPVLEIIIARILVGAGKNADHTRLNFIFDRLIGKVSEKVEHTMPKPMVIKRFGKDETVILGVQQTEEE